MISEKQQNMRDQGDRALDQMYHAMAMREYKRQTRRNKLMLLAGIVFWTIAIYMLCHIPSPPPFR